MNSNILPYRPGLAAIAAVMALTPTPLMAQDVIAPPPATDTAAPPPATDAPDPLSAAPPATPDPLAAESVAPVTTAAPAAAPAATGRRTPTRATNRAPSTPRAATPSVAATPVAAATIAAPAAEPAPLTEAPVAAPIAPPVEAAAPPAELAIDDGNLVPIAGAAGLGALALLAAGLAARRRQRRDERLGTHAWTEPSMARAADPVAATPAPRAAPVAAASSTAPAFSWGKAAPSTSQHDEPVAAAYRGPTADNPSLSLKKRLKRASFFAQRERAVANGQASPLARTAGLPQALAKGARDLRQRVAAPASISFSRAYQPAFS